MFEKSHLHLLQRLNLSLSPEQDEFSSFNENIQSWLTSSNGRGHFVFDISSFVLTLLLIFIIFNAKLMPGIWHLRILNAFRFTIKSCRPPVTPSQNHIFQPMVTESTAPLMEIDFNLHKSNSSYFADLDISRTHLVCTLFAKGIEEMRGGTGAYTGSKQSHFGVALGAVQCNFIKEIAPYQKYQMWSRVLSWDEKWIYIVTHFVRDGAAEIESSSLYPEKCAAADASGDKFGEETFQSLNSQGKIMATALSRCVFKSGRKTVTPDVMLRLSGLLPDETEGPASEEDDDLKAVESQRQHGLRVASTLAMENQRALEAEFGCGKGPVLGRHSDGIGAKGVVLTLLQLAGLRSTQYL